MTNAYNTVKENKQNEQYSSTHKKHKNHKNHMSIYSNRSIDERVFVQLQHTCRQYI